MTTKYLKTKTANNTVTISTFTIAEEIDNYQWLNTILFLENRKLKHLWPFEEKYHEYFETNIKGAENICNFARETNVNKIIFTSSIAPYGTWEEENTEWNIELDIMTLTKDKQCLFDVVSVVMTLWVTN